MSWEILIRLILQEGLPLALLLAEKWRNKAEVTTEELEELKALGAKNNIDQVTAALVRAGVGLDTPQAQSLLNLVK